MSLRTGSRGVEFIGINSNVQDSMDELKDYATSMASRFRLRRTTIAK